MIISVVFIHCVVVYYGVLHVGCTGKFALSPYFALSWPGQTPQELARWCTLHVLHSLSDTSPPERLISTLNQIWASGSTAPLARGLPRWFRRWPGWEHCPLARGHQWSGSGWANRSTAHRCRFQSAARGNSPAGSAPQQPG